MTSWINSLENEDDVKAERERKRIRIWHQSRFFIDELRKLVEENVAKVNEQIFQGKDTIQVDHKFNYDGTDRANDFCVEIDTVPIKGNRMPDEKYNIARLYVKYDYEKMLVRRVLETSNIVLTRFLRRNIR